jgi:hypothetical protein
MGYSPSIPQPNDDPKDSQAQLLSNFSLLNTRWSVNHVPLTQSTNTGMHTKVFFEAPLGADPGLGDDFASLYTKTFGGATELFFENASAVKQLTGLVPTTNGTQHLLQTPWDMEIQMGSDTGAAVGSNFEITFTASFTAAAPVVYTAIATGINATSVRIVSVTKTKLTYKASEGANIQYFIMASAT